MNVLPTMGMRACAALMLLSLAPSAAANISVYPMRVGADTEKGANIRVLSQSEDPQYINLTMKKIVAPGQPEEQEVDLDGGARAPMVASPSRFALPGGGSRLVRLIPLDDIDVETAYRVYVESTGGTSDAIDITLEESPDSSASLSVNLVWGVLVNLAPKNGHVDMQINGNELHNTGTLRLGVTRVDQCDAAGKQCIEHSVQRSVYPGQRIALPFQPTAGQRLIFRYLLTHDPYQEQTHQLSI